MRWVTNLPDSKHTPFPVLEEEPHIKRAVSYFRAGDWATMGAWGTIFPGAFYLSEMIKPSIHPRLLGRVMAVQIPFFLGAGFLYSLQNSYFRFWGWKENSIEAKRFDQEGGIDAPQWKSRNSTWSEADW